MADAGDELLHYRIVVAGRVQGVGFRNACRQVATREGVGGWVRNRPDGTVEAVFEGGREPLERLVAWCQHGPPHARVTAVEVTPGPFEALVGFALRA